MIIGQLSKYVLKTYKIVIWTHMTLVGILITNSHPHQQFVTKIKTLLRL